MKPLFELRASEAQKLEGLFFDLDDTVLDEGELAASTYDALFALKKSGLALVVVTGRPSSWVQVVARMWPVDAAISENGALGFMKVGSRLRCLDGVEAVERQSRRQRLSALAQEMRRQFSELVPTDDVGGRVSDYTFDIGEFQQVEAETVRRAREFARQRGARTTVSSVHLHITFDRVDKAIGALAYAGRTMDVTRARYRYAFIGDSQNDAPCFAAFKTTVGVANCRGRFSIPPRYLTRQKRGAGFVEFATQVCRLRGQGSDHG